MDEAQCEAATGGDDCNMIGALFDADTISGVQKTTIALCAVSAVAAVLAATAASSSSSLAALGASLPLSRASSPPESAESATLTVVSMKVPLI